MELNKNYLLLYTPLNVYSSILFISFVMCMYFVIRNNYVYYFIKKVNLLIYKYNAFQIETFFKVQFDCIENELPLMDTNNIKSIEYLDDEYWRMLFSFKKLTIENYLDKKIIEELNKVK